MTALIITMNWFRFDTYLIDQDLIYIALCIYIFILYFYAVYHFAFISYFYIKNNRARYIAKSLKFEFCSGIVVQFRDSEFVMSLRNYGIGLAFTESETKMSPCARLRCIMTRSFTVSGCLCCRYNHARMSRIANIERTESVIAVINAVWTLYCHNYITLWYYNRKNQSRRISVSYNCILYIKYRE